MVPALALISVAQHGNLPPHIAADPGAPEVTAQNIPRQDRFWPYHVSVIHPPADPALRHLTLETPGVLLRVEDDGFATIDFGRDGLHRVPIASTNLLAQAERIRTGALPKEAPNFTFLIGARLLRSDQKAPVPLPFSDATAKSAYVCIVTSTAPGELEAVARSIGSLPTAPNVMPVLFPMGDTSDKHVHERLRALNMGWAFLPDHLSEAYARALVPETMIFPAVVVVSDEGRILATIAWSADAPTKIAPYLSPPRTR